MSVKNRTDGKSLLRKALKWMALILAGLVALVVVCLIGLTVWLNPGRLSKLVSEEASKYLYANVEVSNLRFTVWSTFPRFRLVADSVKVRSRALDSLPEAAKRRLPPGASYLGGCGNFSGAVNLRSLLHGEICLHDVEIKGFDLNIVAVNDSVANFMIFPESNDIKTKIPFMSANSIRLTEPKTIAYRSLQSGLIGEVRLKDIELRELGEKGEKRNSYDLDLSGRVLAQVDSLVLLNDFPFRLDGVVNLRFDPFGIAFNDYAISLGNIQSHASMNFEAGAAPKINNLSFDIQSFHLMRLLTYLPPQIFPKIEGLDADVMVNASARLTKPYHFSSSALPSVEVSFSVPDGDVAYTAVGGSQYSARHIGLNGRFIFDGDDPSASYVDVPRFSVEGEGVDLDLAMKITDLLNRPHVQASVEVGSQIENLREYFAALAPFHPSGDVEITTDIDFTLPSYSATEIEDLKLNGSLKMKNTRFVIPQAEATARARNTNVCFSTAVARLDQSTDRFPVDIEGSMGGIDFTLGRKERTDMTVSDLSFSGRVGGVHKTRNPDSIAVAVAAKRLEAKRPGLLFSLRNFSTTLCAASENRRIRRPGPVSFSDSAMLRRLPHTPEVISFSISDSLRRLMANTRLRGSVKLSDGVLKLKNYPSAIMLGSCDMDWSFDSVAIRRFSFRSGESALALAGSVSNLRQFLNYPDRSVLKARLKADIDTLNINQLARAYETAVKAAGLGISVKDSLEKAKRQAEAYARQDTTALILPRNIDLAVRAKAKEVVYTNLFFRKVRTDLTMADGIARIKDLRMAASFAGAGANVVYDTSDIENIALDGDVGIYDLDLVKMYRKFPSIERNFPEVLNLSGRLSLNAGFHLGVFPTMTADIPGFTANVAFEGRDLKLHQTEFIHKIARMLMIFNRDDIHIADININGNVHANLLELYPFNLDFEHYRLRLQGLNNFGGDLYYHIGVDRSPIPFRFGIEVDGKYRHPKLRFCGSGWSSDKARGITSHIMTSGSFNFVSEARSGMKAFVHEAAKSNVRQ